MKEAPVATIEAAADRKVLRFNVLIADITPPCVGLL
jgi:hypothetical protein